MKIDISTLFYLGLTNIVTILLYRLATRSCLVQVLLPEGQGYRDPLFHDIHSLPPLQLHSGSKKLILKNAERLRAGDSPFFPNQSRFVGSPPDWFLNSFNNACYANLNVHWSTLTDFDSNIGDIKCIWEMSRFDWALVFAKAYRLTDNEDYLTFLNTWTSDWTEKNPLNIGPNWKCGQEAAIRMMHIFLAAYLLQQHRTPTEGLKQFIRGHCARIAPTIHYAIAQNNNHGTSEAAALYIGGAWLFASYQDKKGRSAKLALRYHRSGKDWLEDRVCKLIASDGSFSQHSLNYHRVVLDTLNIVEFWRRELRLPEFSDPFYERARAAVTWLHQMLDPETGDGPNLGANDGTRLFVLSSTDYRDYRPSVQLGSVLFFGEKIYPKGAWDEPLAWLSLDKVSYPTVTRERKSCILRGGGYVMMYFPTSWAVIRFPNFRFRPAHADAFHLDLWHNGLNILRDSGSYSYNTEEPWQSYFPSTRAHNTVAFDGRDQMPRISRFLFGSWLKMETVGELTQDDGWLSWTGSYRDYKGGWHKRTVSSNGRIWKIIDNITGFDTKAVLRWRLIPGTWQVKDTICVGDIAELSVDASVPIIRCELKEGWESRSYMEKTGLPVLEVEVKPGYAVLTTEIHLKG